MAEDKKSVANKPFNDSKFEPDANNLEESEQASNEDKTKYPNSNRPETSSSENESDNDIKSTDENPLSYNNRTEILRRGSLFPLTGAQKLRRLSIDKKQEKKRKSLEMLSKKDLAAIEAMMENIESGRENNEDVLSDASSESSIGSVPSDFDDLCNNND